MMGRLCFDMCLSACPHLGEVPWPGPAGGVPLKGVPQWVVPHLRYPPQTWMGVPPPQVPPPPCRTWTGGTQTGGIPHLGSPRSDLDRGEVPQRGGTPLQLTDGVLDKWRSVCLLHSHRRTFLLAIKLACSVKC